MQSITGYDAFNEIRCLNNAIKHNGKVSIELINVSSAWDKGKPLTDLDKHFN